MGIAYMGTKSRLNDEILSILGMSRQGPLLDLFAGTCSVARSASASRPIWTNDALRFPALFAKQIFAVTSGPPAPIDAMRKLKEKSLATARMLYRENKALVELERHAIARALMMHETGSLRTLFDERFSKGNVLDSSSGLFTRSFGGIYFSLEQTITIDAIRSAIVDLDKSEEAFGNWIIVALGIAISKCNAGPGHFAQPLAPKESNGRRLARQRSRSILHELSNGLSELNCLWQQNYSSRSRCFNDEATSLLTRLHTEQIAPSVIYADPPYTKDQYSRFYHVYDTLVTYEDLGCSGRGRYPEGRFISQFSTAGGKCAWKSLVSKAHALGSDLVISYPSNGILERSEDYIPELVQTYFGKYPSIRKLDYSHSTMGASKGAAKKDVTEIIYRASIS